MVLTLQLASICINFQEYHFNELLIWLTWIPFFTLPYYLSQKKSLYRIAATLLFIEGFITLIHWILLKGPITASSIFILLNTNFQEASEFVSLKFSARLLWIIPYVGTFIWTIAKPPKIVKNKYNIYGIIGIFLFATVLIGEAIVHKRFIRSTAPQTTEAFIVFSKENRSYKLLNKRTIIPVEATLTDRENSHIFVLIIGESLNRNHLSLYGYHRKTTPLLDQREDIFVYNDVVSYNSHTISSIFTMLTESDMENQKPYNESISLNDLFYHAGFKTFWLSNQFPIGIWDNAVYNLSQTFQTTHYTNNRGNSSFESTYKSPYDEILFKPFITALNGSSKNKFIVLHLMGNHSSYNKRYTSDYEYFTNYSSHKEKIINQYDNSVLYNDFVIDSLFSILSIYSNDNQQDIVSAIYLSDHGENVYDDNNDVGHGYSGQIPRSIVEIPFMVWLSPSYQNQFPEKASLVLQNKNLPFMSDHLFESILDLNFIHSPNINLQNSIFHSTYITDRKRILEDGTDYDLIHQK